MIDRLGVGVIGLGLAVKPHALALRDLAEKGAFIGGYNQSAERRAAFTHTYGLSAVLRSNSRSTRFCRFHDADYGLTGTNASEYS